MLINEEALLSKRRDSSAKTVKAKDDRQISGELKSTQSETHSLIEQQNLTNAIDYILFNDLLNKFGVFGAMRNTNRTLLTGSKINRGRLLAVDFGTHNVGSEASFYHPAVVIKNYPKFVVVVPVTTDTGQTFPTEIEAGILRVKKDEYPQFLNNSILQLFQVRAIHKNRIRKDLKATIANTALMKEIDKRVVELYSPSIKQELLRLQQENADKDAIIDELREALNRYELEMGPGLAEAAATKQED